MRNKCLSSYEESRMPKQTDGRWMHGGRPIRYNQTSRVKSRSEFPSRRLLFFEKYIAKFIRDEYNLRRKLQEMQGMQLQSSNVDGKGTRWRLESLTSIWSSHLDPKEHWFIAWILDRHTYGKVCWWDFFIAFIYLLSLLSLSSFSFYGKKYFCQQYWQTYHTETAVDKNKRIKLTLF